MTGKRRLQVLANYLVSGAVDEDQFDMNDWPSCAIGEGTRIPSLSKEGLGLTRKPWPEPEYRGKTGIDACASFFRVPYTAADRIFGMRFTKKTAVGVGRQIMSYLRRH